MMMLSFRIILFSMIAERLAEAETSLKQTYDEVVALKQIHNEETHQFRVCNTMHTYMVAI